MNKEASLKTMIMILIGISLGVVILLFSLNIGNAFWGLLFPDISELSKTYLDDLGNEIDGLEVGKNTTTAYYINDKFLLIAFDKNNKPISDTGGFYVRPTSCFNVACLVICKDSNSENACKSSEEIKIFPNIEKFEVTDPITNTISLTKGKYVNLYLERMNDITFIIKEINEN
jgi:hypothetical protein